MSTELDHDPTTPAARPRARGHTTDRAPAFFLTPAEAVNQVMGYLLGLCLARRSSLLLFAFFAHVNHYSRAAPRK